MKRVLISMLMLAGGLQAADYTFNWDKAFPDNGEKMMFKDGNGKTRVEVSLFLTNITTSLSSPKAYCIEKMWVYPDEGGTITFTGEPMTFIMPKNMSRIYFYTNDCRLVFQNVVTNRITEVYYMGQGTSKTRKWSGGVEFVGSEWKKILDDARLDDWRPADSCKQVSPGENSLTKGWENRDNTFYAQNFVRHGGVATLQYQSALTVYNGERYYKVVKMELKQGEDGIYVRALSPTFKIVVPEGVSGDFDVDTIEAGEKRIEKHLFVNTDGVMSGYGVNTMEFIREKPLATVRYENKVHYSTTVRPHGNIRVEFAGEVATAERVRSGESAFMMTEEQAEIAFVDTSVDNWEVVARTSGGGRLVFERTTAGGSKVVLSGDKQNVMQSTGEYIVRGTSDGLGKMILKIDSKEQLPQSNNVIRVENGGEFVLNVSGECANQCRILVSKGGLFRQKGTRPFKSGVQQIVADGGVLQFNHENTEDVYLYDTVTLKNGAIMIGSDKRSFVQLNGKPGNRILVCGDTPSTNNAGVSLMSQRDMVCTNVFHVLKTGGGAYVADLVQNGDILEYQGSSPYAKGHFFKSGDGTMLLNGAFTSTNEAIIAGGKIVFGESASWTNTNTKGSMAAAPIALEGTELEVHPGKKMRLGRLSRVEGESKLVVGANASLEFQNSSACASGWTEGSRLDITVGDGAYVRFGDGATGLTEGQRSSLRLNGKAATLNSDGVVCGIGFFVIIR
ncbi:MAG: hypothetical protein IKK82_11885 [Kiritimatiellae bacterium]|nr:hypothetical protein [Kiritimatiellia bacterium]